MVRCGSPRPDTQLFDFDDLDHAEGPPDKSISAAIKTPRPCCSQFLTFGNGRFATSARRLAGEVVGLGQAVFQEVHAMTSLPQVVESDPRWLEHLGRGASARGYGWWFWKSVLVRHLLDTDVLRDGDLIAYGDAGCSVNPLAGQAWLELLSRVGEAGSFDFVCFQGAHAEWRHTKGDTFRRFGLQWDSQEFGATPQLVGGYWACRICPATRRFFELWESLAEDVQLISDDEPLVENPHFVENRHDQSLFSMIVKSNRPTFGMGATTSSVSNTVRTEFAISSLRVLVLPDCGWPVAPRNPRQLIAASRLDDAALRNRLRGRDGEFGRIGEDDDDGDDCSSGLGSKFVGLSVNRSFFQAMPR